MQLREIEDWVMERHLKQVPGVADVVSFGGFVKQYQVQVDPQQLQARGLALRQVFDALGRSNANAGGNYIEHGDEQYIVRGLGTLAGSEDIENVVVAARGGTPIRIRDVARVTIGAMPRRGIVTRNRDPEAVEGTGLMRRGENPSVVLDALVGAGVASALRAALGHRRPGPRRGRRDRARRRVRHGVPAAHAPLGRHLRGPTEAPAG